MTLSSMTGFARARGGLGGWHWDWELKSVNGKGLDVRLRLPSGFDGQEQVIRKSLQDVLGRGNVTVHLSLDQDQSEPALRINHDWLQQLISVARSDADGAPVDVAALMSVRGVVELAQDEAVEDQQDARDAAILETLTEAAAALVRARQDEGARLHAVLMEQVETLDRLTAEASVQEAARPEARQARLRRGLAELLQMDPPVTEERLAQELALQIVRSDIAEEIERLRAHIAQARELLAADEPVGRRLDFLAQEFNREANTLCSKSSDVALTRIGMEMKVAIDRFREQVQNIE